MNKYRNVSDLLGKTIVDITGAEDGSEEIIFMCSDGTVYKMYHEQDCCESVTVDDVCGSIRCLLDSPLTMAEEIYHSSDDEDGKNCPYAWCDSYTWTWYKFATVKGYVTIRWFGGSNGYYSESVDFAVVEEDDDDILDKLGDLQEYS